MSDSKNKEAGLGHYSDKSGENSSSSGSSATAIIGPKIRIKGELIGEENLMIQGYVEGVIDLKDNSLTIGKEGKLKADVSAKMIMVEGEVEGDLFGEERVVIHKTSNIQGNIVADRLSIEEGAKFRGSIDMGGDARAALAKKKQPTGMDRVEDSDTRETTKEKLKKVVAAADSVKARYTMKTTTPEGAQS